MLRKRYNQKNGRMEWALVSKGGAHRVLKWFGTRRPSRADVEREERRIERFR